jgi:hypothetical protein
MPAFKEQIFGQRENILEESPTSTVLNANPLVTFINQTKNRVQEKSKQIEGQQNGGEVLFTMSKMMFQVIAPIFENIVILVFSMPTSPSSTTDIKNDFLVSVLRAKNRSSWWRMAVGGWELNQSFYM